MVKSGRLIIIIVYEHLWQILTEWIYSEMTFWGYENVLRFENSHIWTLFTLLLAKFSNINKTFNNIQYIGQMKFLFLFIFQFDGILKSKIKILTIDWELIYCIAKSLIFVRIFVLLLISVNATGTIFLFLGSIKEL